MVRVALATDSFPGASINAAWKEANVATTHFDTDGSGNCKVINGGGNRCGDRTDVSPDAEQYSEAIITINSGSAVQMGVTVRGQDDNRCYFIMARDGAWELGKMAADRSDTQLGAAATPVGISYPVTGTLRLEAEELVGVTTLRAYWNNGGGEVLIATRTDVSSPYTTAGRVGIFGNGGTTATLMASWEGGNLYGVVAPDPVTDLTCTRDAPDNVLDWTASADGVNYHIARSATGVGDPGVDGTDGDWELIEAAAGAVETYTDTAHARAYYAVRALDGDDNASAWEFADDVLAMTAVSDLDVARDDPDNVLTWTADALADTQEIARSPSGVGDPGVDGLGGDWVTVIDDLSGALETYTDVGVDPAFYMIRWRHAEGDVSAWSNLDGNVSGTKPVCVWMSYSGGVLTDPADTRRFLVAAAHPRSLGGLAYVNFAVSVNGGAATNIQATAPVLTSGNEVPDATDPLPGLSAGEQMTYYFYGITVLASAYAEGTIDVTPTAVPVSGAPRAIATHRIINNKSGGITPPSDKVIHLDGTGGNDASNGLTEGASKLTMQAAIDAAKGTGNDCGNATIVVHNVSYWNRASGTSTAFCSDGYRLYIDLSDGELMPEPDFTNKPVLAPSSGKLRLCFLGGGTGIIRQRFRTQVDGDLVDVAFDHLEWTSYEPFDTGTNPSVPCRDGATQGPFWCDNANDEPSAAFYAGCHLHHIGGNWMVNPNTSMRGCLVDKGFGVFGNLPTEGNIGWVGIISNWRHASDQVDGVFSVTGTHFEALQSPDRAGKLRVRNTTGNPVATAFAAQAAFMVGSSDYGCRVEGFANAAGNADQYAVLGAGTDGSSRQWVDLDVAFFTEAESASVTLRTGRLSDGEQWSTIVHSDTWKVDAPKVPENVFLAHTGGPNGTPRGFGWDSGMTSVLIENYFGSLGGQPTATPPSDVRDDDFGITASPYIGVMLRRCSFNGGFNPASGADTTDCEMGQCIFDSVSTTSLPTLESKWDIYSCHFVNPAHAIGENPTTGVAFLQADPGVAADATLDPLSSAVGTAGDDLGDPDGWFLGDRGVILPFLAGDFTPPEAPAPPLDAINDLTCELDLPDNNVLAWTPKVGATAQHVAKSATGIGDPGAAGTSSGWSLVTDAVAGAESSYIDEGVVPAYYRVRWTDGSATSDWSNVANDIPGSPGGGVVVGVGMAMTAIIQQQQTIIRKRIREQQARDRDGG